MKVNARELLEAGGPLSRWVKKFSPREQQQQMAELVETAIANAEKLVVEAGTGVGKTFAYLAPALLSNLKIIVSTGTRHLQDQLYHKDLPIVRKALGVPIKTSLLKGRANYLCIHRLQLASQPEQQSSLKRRDLETIRHWASTTKTGDIAELSTLPEDASLWSQITSTSDNCLGLDCPSYQDCYVVKARRTAQEADLVVINHHLFFADLAIKEEGFGELLPSANAFVLDEAHQLLEIASSFFGIRVSSRQLHELVKDIIAEHLEEAPQVVELRSLANTLKTAIMDLRLAFGVDQQRRSWQHVRHRTKVSQSFQNLMTCLASLHEALEEVAPTGKGLLNCCRRVTQIITSLKLMDEDSDDLIRWFETHQRSFVLHVTPLEIAQTFRKYLQSYPCAWIFTSATLSVGDTFEHFTTRLGLDDARCKRLDSPYDFKNHALLYLPQGIADPGSSSYIQSVVAAAIPVIQACEGGAFLLFTSHRALSHAATLLEGEFNYPLLVQGTAPRHELLAQFRAAGNAVLLGTSSFWEGVDVRGPALSCVIIDKLPFMSPSDPVTQAKLEMLNLQGRNPFFEYQVPQAVITLKQGVGRLIRDDADTGVLVICDPRLLTKSYGNIFLSSLPEMANTRNLATVASFLKSCHQAHEAVSR